MWSVSAAPAPAEVGERLHPDIPLPPGPLLVVDKLNPPAKNPQETPASLRRLPMFVPSMETFLLFEEQVSPAGSASLIRVSDPPPSSTKVEFSVRPVLELIPLVCPETTLRAPGVEGPKFVSYMLSLIAKCWA